MTDRGSMKVIGGSTISGILDNSPWESPYSVWLKLTGRLQAGQETEAMSRGHALEPVVAAMYAANHPEYAVETMGMVYHPEYPYIVGSPDRVLIQDGELVAGLEIKTANISDANQWGVEETDQIPEHYFMQTMFYAGLLNVPVWYVAVGFVPAERRKIITYREYEVRLDKAIFESMLRLAVKFWKEHIEADVPPEITEPDAQITQYFRNKYPRHEDGKWLPTTAEVNELAERLLGAKETLDTATREFDLCKTLMIAMLGDAEGVTTSAGKITYRGAKPTRSIDWQNIALQCGATTDLIEQFTTERPGSRRFLLPR